jgi:hypothetical protein
MEWDSTSGRNGYGCEQAQLLTKLDREQSGGLHTAWRHNTTEALHRLLDGTWLQRTSGFCHISCDENLSSRGKFIHIFIVAQCSVGDCQQPFLVQDLAQFFGLYVAACAQLLPEVPSESSMKSLAECQSFPCSVRSIRSTNGSTTSRDTSCRY